MKIFAISDIHGFYGPMIKALNEKGFEPNNPDHLLVVCGDCFDRGPGSYNVYDYLRQLRNCVIVRGNHEDLMELAFKRGYLQDHDIHNGVGNTLIDISTNRLGRMADSVQEALQTTYLVLKPFLKSMVNYFETKNYIFVHGWIPGGEDWRNASNYDWEKARWENGIDNHFYGLTEPGKTIVCGHWHCSYGHSITKGIPPFGEGAEWSPFAEEGILAIDRCTAHTGECNVVVLEDELLEENEDD